MRKKYNWRMESIDMEAENFKEARDLDEATKNGILEKVDNKVWRARA